MKHVSDPHTEKKIKSIRAKAARFDTGFRRQYPLLVKYIDGTAPLEHCSARFYREKVQKHMQLIDQMHQEADRLEALTWTKRPPAQGVSGVTGPRSFPQNR
ncbi:hypothetical protein LJC22_05350 [Desulfosarcina sp. OttesenSCG-928-G10]|nr:hypothetical protein [Desulfosarcina sp. OttesenSCG-928-G10]